MSHIVVFYAKIYTNKYLHWIYIYPFARESPQAIRVPLPPIGGASCLCGLRAMEIRRIAALVGGRAPFSSFEGFVSCL
jgi:hypothetical protein